jgi:Putative restriction endonuclease
MTDPYEEKIQGETTLRFPPGARHELICARLHSVIKASIANFPGMKLLELRSAIRVDANNLLRPDLAIATAATGKVWLAAEIVSSEDHHADTVDKKQIYEAMKLPRLWMIDPRYNNVEIYHATEYGMRLEQILAGSDVLTEKLLPEFQVGIADLFEADQG